MAYRGTEAVRLADVERTPRVGARPELDVVRGGGIDAEVRRGVSHELMGYVLLAASALALFMVLGAVRVQITTRTVQCLRTNVDIRSDIAEAELVNSDLRIECAVLSNSSRITRIAEQSYGMVHASQRDTITLGAEDEETLDPQAQLEAETTEEAQVATSVEPQAMTSEPSVAEGAAEATASQQA